MGQITANINEIQELIGERNCRLIAVSKTKPIKDIKEAYAGGLRDFGENKVQELVEKAEKLPQEIRWHMIGHLQRNKVKYIAPFVHLIHSVDTFKLLKEINKQGEKIGRVIPCLLQMHIAKEETKFGFDEEEVIQLIEGEEFKSLSSISVKGLMGMATFTDNEEQIKNEFGGLVQLFHKLENIAPDRQNLSMEELSMGMSNDYKIALSLGSTMLRLGSTIFGARNYTK